MKLINMSVILAASLASTVQARHAVEPHLHPRSYDNSTYPATSTVVVSPVPVTSIPMGTGVSSVGESTTTKITNATLTYTMGYGSSATVITTTVLRTETLTSTHTVYATKGDGDAAETDVDGYNKVATSAGTDAEPTTTVTDRSTTTMTITVESVDPSGSDVSPGQTTDAAGEGYGDSVTSVGGESAGATGTGCAAVATVTETIKSTITVTAGPSGAVTPTDVSPEATSTEEAGTPASSSELPILSASSAAPYTNGTMPSPTKSKKKCASSGFITKAKPTVLPSGYKRS